MRQSTLWVIVAFLINDAFTLMDHADLYTVKNFLAIPTSSYPHFVMFFAPWCKPCQKIENTWDKYAKGNHELKRLKVAKLDCTISTPICAEENIKAYPTFRLFNGRQKYTFRGDRNVLAFNNFVDANIPTLENGKVPETTSTHGDQNNRINEANTQTTPQRRIGSLELSIDTFAPQVEKEGMTFVDFFAPWCSHCRELEPVWEKLADYFKDEPRITIAKVDCTNEPELCKQIDIRGFPTLRLYKNGLLLNQYNLDRSLTALIDYVKRGMYEEYNKRSVAPSTEETIHTAEIGDSLTIESLKHELMVHQKIGVYFYDLRNSDELALDAMLQSFVQELHTKKMPLQIHHVDCNEQKELCDKYEITSLPSFVYFYNGSRFARYHGELTLQSLVKFVEDIETRLSERKDEL